MAARRWLSLTAFRPFDAPIRSLLSRAGVLWSAATIQRFMLLGGDIINSMSASIASTPISSSPETKRRARTKAPPWARPIGSLFDDVSEKQPYIQTHLRVAAARRISCRPRRERYELLRPHCQPF